MIPTYVIAVVLLATPAVTFLAGASGMGYLAYRGSPPTEIREAQDPKDRKPLNRRLLGYNAEEVKLHWAQFDKIGMSIQKHLLEIDLLFPFLYGASLLGPLLFTWIAIGRPFAPVFVLAPISITVIADWTENLVQLNLLRVYQSGKEPLVDPTWVQISSVATTVKLAFFIGSVIYLLILVGKMVSNSYATST